MRRTCEECGRAFYADEDWKRVCLDCWKRRKRREEQSKERDGRIEFDRGYTAGYRDGQRAAARAVASDRQRALDVEALTATIALCHPDRHPPERRATANRVTAMLLELRREAGHGSAQAR